MLKIKKTKPYQFRKSHGDSARNVYARRVACALALICGIVPSLTLLTYYNPYTESTYAARKTLSNITTMQEMTTDICNNSALGQSNTLTDTRDGKAYSVSRLADGNCWMTQNLRLSQETLAITGHSNTLTSTDTDVSEDYELPASGAWLNDNTAQGIIASTDDDYGAYYTWCAATANTCQVDGTPIETGDATSSICPKGWRLPTGNVSGEMQKLYDKWTLAFWANHGDVSGRWFGDTSSLMGGAFFPAAGYIHSTEESVTSINYGGHYWSSTADSSTHSYSLSFNDSVIYPAKSYARLGGRSIRCLAPASNTDFPELFDEKDSTVSVTVPKVLTIDAVSKALTIEADPNQIIEGNISATISANTTYSVQLSAENPDLTNPNDPDHTIPASTNVQKGENAWGILNQDNSTYSAITATPTTYHNIESSNEDSSRTHTFTLGVSVSPTLPAGEYSTTVTITAVNN